MQFYTFGTCRTHLLEHQRRPGRRDHLLLQIAHEWPGWLGQLDVVRGSRAQTLLGGMAVPLVFGSPARLPQDSASTSSVRMSERWAPKLVVVCTRKKCWSGMTVRASGPAHTYMFSPQSPTRPEPHRAPTASVEI